MFAKEKINNYLVKRIILISILFFIVNLVGNLPLENHLTEIFSHFKLHYFYFGFILILTSIYLLSISKKYIIYLFITVFFIVINFVDLSPYFSQEKPIMSDNTLKLGLYNVLTRNHNYNLLSDEIEKENPHFFILQEIDDTWINSIPKLNEKYPYSIIQTRDDNFGIALYSKVPFINAKIEEWTEYKLPVVNATINLNSTPITVYGVHTLPPVSKEYFKVRNEMFEEINKIITSRKENNLIIAGDFNSTSFSPSYKKYIKSTKINDAQTLVGDINQGSWNTFHPPFLRITLEHVLTSQNLKPIEYKHGNFFGSDHYPVFVTIKLDMILVE